MKATQKRMLVVLPAILMLLAALLIPTAVALESEEAAPAVSIDMMNLQFNENVQILYAVNLQNLDPNTVASKDFGMLFWTSPQESYEMGSEEKNLPTSGAMMIGETQYFVFEYRDLAAKQMADDLYARAYVRVGDEVYYSGVQKYSVLQYAYNMLGKTAGGTSNEALKTLLSDMLTYGASAQTYFDYKTDRLANADFYQITVEGGSLSDGTTKGLYLSGETVTLNAPETNADGDPFSHWVNSAEETVATERTYALTVGEANETYTAVYSAVPKYLITVEGGVLTSDNESTSGYFREGETVEFTAPEEITVTTDAGEETVNFSHWENVAEEIIAETLTHTVTVGTTDATYTAVYDTPDSYFVFTKIMDSDLASDVGTYRIGALKETALPSKVVIPKTYNNIAVTQIGSFAYSNIAKILFFDNIGIIGENAFLGCSNLENVKIPSSVRHIRPNAFGGCTSFTNIALPDTITKIDRALFSGCTNLVNITIPNSITSIGNNAFYKCNNLTDVKIPDSVISIGDYAFDNCNSLIEITIPNNTTTIGSYVFRNCTNLSSVKLPNAISKISLYMFQWCENLSSISIPDSVTTIEGGAFDGCSILDTIYYTGTAEEWANITIGSYNDPLTSATVYFYSETEPAIKEDGTGYEGNYWHYDENGEPVIWDLGSLEYTLSSDGTYYYYSVTGIGTYSSSNVIIRSTYEGLPVKEIGVTAFRDQITIISVTVPNSVTTIGARAFLNCINLSNIVIPSSITNIGTGAFDGCSNLANTYINDIEAWLNISFGNQTAHPNYHGTLHILDEGGNEITEVIIPDSITNISNYSFYGCSNLTSIIISHNVTSIGQEAFVSCKNLSSIIISNSVTSIGRAAFAWCQNLTNITIPDSVTTLGAWAFQQCTNLSKITISDALTSIELGLFHGCSSLTSITIPNNVINIYDSAFTNCINLTSITIPDSVTNIGNYAFSSGSSLAAVYYTGTAEEWANITIGSSNDPLTSATVYYYSETEPAIKEDGTGYDGNYWHYDENGEPAIWDLGSLEYTLSSDGTYYSVTGIGTYSSSNVIIRSTYEGLPVTQIADSAFSNQTAIMNVTVPDSILSIGNSAFYYCNNLQSIILPDTITQIGHDAFNTCSTLENIHIPKALTVIEDATFYGCWNLIHITIPNTITTISMRAFEECLKLTTVTFEENSQLTSIGIRAFDGCYNLSTICIPKGVTFIGARAFEGCGLTSVTFEDGIQLTSIADYLFMNCEKLTSIAVPNGVQTIGYGAFTYCYALKDVSLPNSVLRTSTSSFYKCTSLSNIILGNNINYIASQTFQNCESLDTVYYTGTAEEWENITIGSSNDPLTSATVYFYSETAPALNSEGTAYDGNYWYYDENGEPAIWVYVAE